MDFDKYWIKLSEMFQCNLNRVVNKISVLKKGNLKE